MEFLSTSKIREMFIKYFVDNEHIHVPSSNLIPKNDPSLLFVNAGMVQFKTYFTGIEQSPFSKAVTVQKVLRVGGKHNDLENVGYTPRHHSFFEMLGNFSFGDYFKEQAIFYAWEFLTKFLKLPKERLYITVYAKDQESFDLWKKISSISEKRIVRVRTQDNFWSMGDLGPCGPCSEVFYDQGESLSGYLSEKDGCVGDRYLEIWNLVFMEYEKIGPDKYIKLPTKSVDTGMGLERIASVMQVVANNFDTDLFKDIISHTQEVLKIHIRNDNLYCYRILADHIKASSFLIADGILPSNEGRGYVLRRIIRRAMRYAYQMGVKNSFIHKIFPRIIYLFSDTYPELSQKKELIRSVFHSEEEIFIKTLEKGIKLLEKTISAIDKNGVLSGSKAFELYDTYGFPLDLTYDLLKEKNISVDLSEFNRKMSEQKNRSRSSWQGNTLIEQQQIWKQVLLKFGPTKFCGYELDSLSSEKILFLIQDNNFVESVSFSLEPKQFIVIVAKTPFYAESGGQKGDIGFISSDKFKIRVLDTKKYLGKIHAHLCEIVTGYVSVGDFVDLEIDSKYRHNLKIHHSATHILHFVLRDILGEEALQKGSLVADNYLRFDFSYHRKISYEEIRSIETQVNQIIFANKRIIVETMDIDRALSLGCLAIFSEKYDKLVRVVFIGDRSFEDGSRELCGGTHVDYTGEIGLFKIVLESSISTGVRRIEARCNIFALDFVLEEGKILSDVSAILNVRKESTTDKISSLISEQKRLNKNLDQLTLRTLLLSCDEIKKQSSTIGDICFLYLRKENITPKTLQNASLKLVKSNAKMVLVYYLIHNKMLFILITSCISLDRNCSSYSISKKFVDLFGGNVWSKNNFSQISLKKIISSNEIHKALKEIVLACQKLY